MPLSPTELLQGPTYPNSKSLLIVPSRIYLQVPEGISACLLHLLLAKSNASLDGNSALLQHIVLLPTLALSLHPCWHSLFPYLCAGSSFLKLATSQHCLDMRPPGEQLHPYCGGSLGSGLAPMPAGWHCASSRADDSVERHSRDRERDGPREVLLPTSRAGGGSFEKQITMAVTLSTEDMSKLDCTCMHAPCVSSLTICAKEAPSRQAQQP